MSPEMRDGDTPWEALRVASKLSAAEVERRLGWKRGHLSWIERGVKPTAKRERQLRKFYAELLLEAGDAATD